MAVMELCLASRFSLYLCVSVYTECLYTHDRAFMHNLSLGKENPDFSSFLPTLMCILEMLLSFPFIRIK